MIELTASADTADREASQTATGPGPTPTVTDLEVELLVDRLWALGAAGVAETRTDGRVHLVAGYDDEAAAKATAEGLADLGAHVVEQRRDRWVEHWRRDRRPVVAGPITVRLPEHEPTGAEIDLVIEPGAAFGYGHATTRLCLETIGRLFTAGPIAGIDVATEPAAEAQTSDACGAVSTFRPVVADVGCGTGVLAIAAAALGASRVVAVDIDAEAVERTRANAERNGLELEVSLGSIELLEAGAFDLVVANVTAGIQRQIGVGLVTAARPGGTLVLSGLLDDQIDSTVDAMHGTDEVERASVEGWAAVVLRRTR